MTRHRAHARRTRRPRRAPAAEPRHAAPTEDGITTAEYAVGTAAGAGLAGLLYKLLTGGFGDRLLKHPVRPRPRPAGHRVRPGP